MMDKEWEIIQVKFKIKNKSNPSCRERERDEEAGERDKIYGGALERPTWRTDVVVILARSSRWQELQRGRLSHQQPGGTEKKLLQHKQREQEAIFKCSECNTPLNV